MNREFITRHWYACIYEQLENETHDVDFLLNVLKEQCGDAPQNILEMACGGGRISIPLAQAGHTVIGFDADEHMLLRCYRKMQGLKIGGLVHRAVLPKLYGGADARTHPRIHVPCDAVGPKRRSMRKVA